VSGKRVTEIEKSDAVTSKRHDRDYAEGVEVAMAQSSPQRRRYLAARRRGLTQAQAMRQTGISRSSAWRYDVLLHQEEDVRVTVLERVEAARAAREGDHDDALAAAADKGVEIQGEVPMPSWAAPDVPAKPEEEGLLDPETELDPRKFPVGLVARLQRRENAGVRELPRRHPANRGITVAHGEMPLSEDMSGRLSRPFLPEDPPNILPGAV
jgi:hypothetical protein